MVDPNTACLWIIQPTPLAVGRYVRHAGRIVKGRISRPGGLAPEEHQHIALFRHGRNHEVNAAVRVKVIGDNVPGEVERDAGSLQVDRFAECALTVSEEDGHPCCYVEVPVAVEVGEGVRTEVSADREEAPAREGRLTDVSDGRRGGASEREERRVCGDRVLTDEDRRRWYDDATDPEELTGYLSW